jgi:DNA-binding CsgD family transcriptional regulator
MIRGEAGIGKTALLDAAARELSGIHVVRADGFEAESAMPYATLQRLGAPVAEFVPTLPPRQASALRIAAGLDDGPPPDRFLVGLGMLSLLAAASEREPIVCVVDDAHLVDPESLEVLAFVARRLEAESVLVVLSARPDPRVEVAAAGVPVLELGGLDTVEAAQLLNRAADEAVDPLLAAQIAADTGGNPLALIDLSREFTARQLANSWAAPHPTPVGPRLESHYLEQVTRLGDDSQMWLLVAAAESTGDRGLIGGAADRLGLAADAAADAERANLASVHDAVSFRHPLVRSAVYNGMPESDRRRVHEALRSEAEARGRQDLAVWHAAAATVGPDARVADALERAADSAGERGGSASRARLLTRAAELSPTAAVRGGRLLAAAEAAASAGAAQLAGELVDRIEDETLDAVGAGRVAQLRALIALFVADRDRILTGPSTMLQAAELFQGVVPALEQRALIWAFDLTLTVEWAIEGVTLPELGGRLAAGVDAAEGPLSTALRGLSAHILLPYSDAVPVMREALDMLFELDEEELLEIGTFGVALSMALWDERACVRLLERMAGAARSRGRLRDLDTVLWLLGLIELVRGDPAASGRYIDDVRELRHAIGYDAEQVVNGSYLAWAGAPVSQVEAIAEAVLATGFAGAWTIAMMGLSVRGIADGHYRDAFERLRPMIERPFLQVTYQQLPEYVEAGVRSGKADLVRASHVRLEEFAAHSGTPWIRGLAARGAALLASDEDAEALYAASIGHLAQSTVIGELGRAHLLYGEWLRRMKRRREARVELRSALEIFERVQAPAFAARARRELEATGEHVLAHTPGESAVDALTPQEDTVARLAAAGRTNAEIGAELFISANTVDYHLRKVFRKLGITSRRQLAEHISES